MSFFLRAALAIGVLSYLAAQRQGERPDLSARPDPVRAAVDTAGLATGSIGALVAALPPDMRAEVARAGAEALARRLAQPRPSADTLLPNDRRPAWRGIE